MSSILSLPLVHCVEKDKCIIKLSMDCKFHQSCFLIPNTEAKFQQVILAVGVSMGGHRNCWFSINNGLYYRNNTMCT